MATYQVRGSSHNIIYLYRTDDGKSKQHWETYETELEAIQRKAYIELLQKEKRYDDIRLAVLDYKRRRAIEKTQRELAQANAGLPNVPMPSTKEDNTHQTFKHFMERFLPFYARKKRFSPNTYDSYISNLNNHLSLFQQLGNEHYHMRTLTCFWITSARSPAPEAKDTKRSRRKYRGSLPQPLKRFSMSSWLASLLLSNGAM